MRTNRKQKFMTKTFICLNLMIAILLTTALPIMANEKKQTDTKKRIQEESSKHRYEGDGFDSPEAAMEAYLEALRNEDLEGAYKCFAIETSAENYTFQNQLAQNQSYYSTSTNKLPIYDDFTKAISTSFHLNEINKMIFGQYCVLAGWAPPLYGMAISIADGNEGGYEGVEDFVDKEFPDTVDLTKIELVSFYDPKEIVGDMWTEKQTKENIKKQCSNYGAQQLESLAAVIQNDMGYFFLAIDSVKYNNKWYLRSGSFLASILGMDTQQGGMGYIGETFDVDDFEKW